MSILELWNSFTKSSKERINSPLYGAFFVSWVSCNWDLVYVTLFVDSNRVGWDKLYFIQANIGGYRETLVNPALLTLVILGIVPLLRIGAIAISERYKILRDDVLQYFDNEKWTSPEDTKALYAKIRETEDEHEKEIERKDKQLATLQKKFDNVLAEAMDLKNENADKLSVIEEREKKAVLVEETNKQLQAGMNKMEIQHIDDLSKIDSLKGEINELKSSKELSHHEDEVSSMKMSLVQWNEIIKDKSIIEFYRSFEKSEISNSLDMKKEEEYFIRDFELADEKQDVGFRTFHLNERGHYVMKRLKREYEIENGQFVIIP